MFIEKNRQEDLAAPSERTVLLIRQLAKQRWEVRTMRSRAKWPFFLGTLMMLLPQVAASQTTPPTVTFTTPPGLQRGTTGTFVIEGTDLAGAT